MTATETPRTRRGRLATKPPTVRVAVYTRKSVTQGLDQDFNSIDAQRQAVENYIASQAGNGWIALPQHYDDGGFTGANTERPAFRQLLADVAAGHIDCVGVYRLDRLSRSLSDYLGILQLFEHHGVKFFSVTEQFNTTTPAGRLVLNQLVLFAQFEREVTAERIRDKMQASRRRGMWTGGRPVLGYDVVEKKLLVNAAEAQRVRDTFALYLESGNLRETAAELKRRGWINKSFVTKSGKQVEGRPFTKATLQSLLTNPLYRGQVRCGDDVVPGMHEPIVSTELWDAVQARLRGNGTDGGGAKAKNAAGAILRGLVRCGRCGSAMTHTFTSRAARRYRYYVCSRHHNEGAKACPKARVPAGYFEQFVAEQIRVIGSDPDLLARVASAVDDQRSGRTAQITTELRRIGPPTPETRQRIAELRAEQGALDAADDADHLQTALAELSPIWDQLFPREQERLLHLLIESITYDPDGGDVELHLRPCGIEALGTEAQAS